MYAPYLCLKALHEEVNLPATTTELALSTAKTLKSAQVWTTKVQSTLLTVVHYNDCLFFEMSILEPQPEKLTTEYMLDGKLVDLDLKEDLSIHLVLKYSDLHAYQKIDLILNTYGTASLTINESYDVTLCEALGRDLDLRNIKFSQGLVVCYGPTDMVTHCTKSQEQLLFESDNFKVPITFDTVKVASLIYVLSNNSLFIINKDLQSKFEQGVIFTLNVGNAINFFVLSEMKLKRELPQLSRVEEFKIENRLKPTGLLLTVTPTTLRIYNFDEDLDKKQNSCQQVSSVTLQSGLFVQASLSKEQDLLLTLQEDSTFCVFQLKQGEFQQINRFRMPLKQMQIEYMQLYAKQKQHKKQLEIVVTSGTAFKVFIHQVQPMVALQQQLSEKGSAMHESDTSDVTSEEPLNLQELQDKNVQKVCKISQKHLNHVNQIHETLEKICQSIKPLNKSLKQQTNQLQARCHNVVNSQQLWTSLKSQSMMSGKQIQKLVPSEPFQQLMKDIDQMRLQKEEAPQSLFKNDLSTVVKLTVELTMKEFIVEPYYCLIDDYIEKQVVESELLDERLTLFNQQL